MNAAFHCIAIETATGHSSVAVSNGVEKMAASFSDAIGSSRQIYQVIKDLLQQAGLLLKDLDCIAFGCGPGSFTGVRIAASVAQGIAYAQSMPVCRVSSLAAIAMGASRAHTGINIAACLDARMGEAYMGLYSVGPEAQPRLLGEDQLVDPADFRFAGIDGPVMAAGPGWDAWPAMLERNRDLIDVVDVGIWPHASDVLLIAEHQFAAGECVRPEEALPNYVRVKVTR